MGVAVEMAAEVCQELLSSWYGRPRCDMAKIDISLSLILRIRKRHDSHFPYFNTFLFQNQVYRLDGGGGIKSVYYFETGLSKQSTSLY